MNKILYAGIVTCQYCGNQHGAKAVHRCQPPRAKMTDDENLIADLEEAVDILDVENQARPLLHKAAQRIRELSGRGLLKTNVEYAEELIERAKKEGVKFGFRMGYPIEDDAVTVMAIAMDLFKDCQTNALSKISARGG
jgi:hypothetical protein